MTLRLRATAGAVRDVRRRVAEWARANGAKSEELRTLSLLTSELVTNAVEHGPPDGAITVDARRDAEGFRVSVTDQGAKQPVVRAIDNTRIRGRGMQLVDLLSSEWGVNRQDGTGTSVWFVVAT